MAMAAQPLPLFLWWSRAASSSLRARFPAATRRRLYSALRRPVTARCEAGSKVLLKGMDYPELEGMGEPFHNIDNVLKASAIMVDEQGLHFSPRKVTVSTSGLVPQLRRFLHESKCILAVSLNATTDEVRNWIMPINRKYNLNLLLGTLREELHFKKNYKVLFEYVMLSGVNDSMDDAKRLVELVQGIPCKINLISFNPHNGSQFKPTPDEKIIEFRNVLIQAGLVVFVRLSRGDDQMAACGQLGKPGDYQQPLLCVPEKFQVAL